MTGPSDPYEGMDWQPGDARTVLLLPNAAMPNRLDHVTVTPWHLGETPGIGVDANDRLLTPDEARQVAALLSALADELDGRARPSV